MSEISNTSLSMSDSNTSMAVAGDEKTLFFQHVNSALTLNGDFAALKGSPVLKAKLSDSENPAQDIIKSFREALEIIVFEDVFTDPDTFSDAAKDIRRMIGMIKGAIRSKSSGKHQRPKTERGASDSGKFQHRTRMNAEGELSVETQKGEGNHEKNAVSVAVELFLRALRLNDSLQSNFHQNPETENLVVDITKVLPKNIVWIFRALEKSTDLEIHAGVQYSEYSISDEEIAPYFAELLAGATKTVIQKMTKDYEQKLRREFYEEMIQSCLSRCSVDDLHSNTGKIMHHVNANNQGVLHVDSFEAAVNSHEDFSAELKEQLTKEFEKLVFNPPNETLSFARFEERVNQYCDDYEDLLQKEASLDEVAQMKADIQDHKEMLTQQSYPTISIATHEGAIVQKAILSCSHPKSTANPGENKYFDTEVLDNIWFQNVAREATEKSAEKSVVILVGDPAHKGNRESIFIPDAADIFGHDDDLIRHALSAILHRTVNQRDVKINHSDLVVRVVDVCPHNNGYARMDSPQVLASWSVTSTESSREFHDVTISDEDLSSIREYISKKKQRY